MSHPIKYAEAAARGFKEIADRAFALHDELRTLGAPMEDVTRADKIQYAATIGERTAVDIMDRCREGAE